MPRTKSTKQSRPEDYIEFLFAGGKLKQPAVSKLEQKLRKNPNDLEIRLTLLGCYFFSCHTSKSDTSKQLQSILWMIDNMPDHKSLALCFATIDKVINPTGFDKCKKLWLKKLVDHKENITVLTNAARFLEPDWRLAEKLYRRAIDLQPKNARLSRELGDMLARGAPKNTSRMKMALKAMQEALAKTKNPEEKYYIYGDLAEVAFEAGEWSIARNAAKKCISLVGRFGNNWNDGNATHDGNCILGRLALRIGRLDKAAYYLEEASKTNGSPQLNSFGPRMQFAEEMLRAGQRGAVVRYLEACKRFWEGRTKKLSDCIAQIEQGKSPPLPSIID